MRAVVLRWGPALAVMAAIFVLSAQSGLRVSNDPGVDLPIRHVAHVAVYAVLALCLVRGLCWERHARPRPRDLLLAIALATLYGVTDEIHQTFVPDRTGHAVDVGWDLVGALLGGLVARLVSPTVLRWPAGARHWLGASQRERGRTNEGPQAS